MFGIIGIAKKPRKPSEVLPQEVLPQTRNVKIIEIYLFQMIFLFRILVLVLNKLCLDKFISKFM